MRAINPRKMADDLRLNKIGQKEFIAYAVFFVATLIFGTYLLPGTYASTTYDPAWTKHIDIAIGILTIFASVAIGYYANRIGDGRQFWYRYLSLDFSITLFLLGVYLVFFITGTVMGVMSENRYTYYDLIVNLGLEILYLYLTYVYMRRAASAPRID